MHLDSLQQAATGRTNERHRGEKSNFDHVRQESGKQLQLVFQFLDFGYFDIEIDIAKE